MALSSDILLVGPGWLGAPLARALAASAEAGRRVWTLRRTPGPAPDGCQSLVGDVGDPAVETSLRAQGVSAAGHVVVAVAPSRARGDDYALYPAAARGARRLAAALGARQLLWISSTGVYGEQGGGVVTERTPAPTHPDDRVTALLDAERHILEAHEDGIQPVVLRPAGLYGPGRDPAPRFRSGGAPMDRWCNFSWRDDVIEAVSHLVRHPPAQPAIFNCTDDRPVEAWRIALALTGARPIDSAPEAPNAGTGRSNQQVSSAALRATGWMPQVVSIFDGLERLGHALPGRAAAEGVPPAARREPHPYGPNTPRIRRFLQGFAGLGTRDATAVVARYAQASALPAWREAEQALAEAIERSGRTAPRDAVAGPLLQLVRRPGATSDDPMDAFEPTAEPALAAVLALLAEELLSAQAMATLYGPFEPVIPRATLSDR